MLKSRRFWLGIAVSLVFLVLFFFQIDFGDVVDSLGDANYLYVLPAVAVYFISLLFRTFRWRYILRPLLRSSTGRLFPVMVVGYMANNLLPVRLGELVRVYYLGQKEQVSKTSALATVAVERVFDGLVLLLFVAVVALALPVAGLVQGLGQSSGIPWVVLALASAVPFVAAIGVLVTISVAPSRFLSLVARLLRLLPSRFSPGVYGLVEGFVEGLAVLRSPWSLLVIFLLSLPVWLAEAVMYFLIAVSFDLQSAFSGWGEMAAALLLVTAVSNLAVALPSSQGGVGPFEFFAAATLVLLDVRRELASAYALVLHVALLSPVTLLGLVYLWLENLSLAQLVVRREAEATPVNYGGGSSR